MIATDRNGNESKPFRRTMFADGALAARDSPRIINGTPAAAADYPFIGALDLPRRRRRPPASPAPAR